MTATDLLNSMIYIKQGDQKMNVMNWVNEGEKIDKYKLAYSPVELANCPYCKHWDTKFKPGYAICGQCGVAQGRLFKWLNKEQEK